MIYVDMKCFHLNAKADLFVDDMISVDNLLTEITKTFPFDKDLAYLFSTDNKKMLFRDMSLKEQGVKGGDTLILIEH